MFLISFYNISDTDLLNTHIKTKTKEGMEVSKDFCNMEHKIYTFRYVFQSIAFLTISAFEYLMWREKYSRRHGAPADPC